MWINIYIGEQKDLVFYGTCHTRNYKKKLLLMTSEKYSHVFLDEERKIVDVL